MDQTSLTRLLQLKTEYSFEEISKKPIFRIFSTRNEPYLYQSMSRSESLSFIDNTKILELIGTGYGQKVGFNDNSKTWFVELWINKIVVKIWKSPDREWGELIQPVDNGSTTERWNYLPYEQEYEMFHLSPENDYGFKCGKNNDCEWKEIWHTRPTSKFLEKYWISPNSKWGEKEGKEDDRTWGEKWYENYDSRESSSWNEQNERKWGRVEGKQGNTTWNEEWSIEPERKFNNKWWADGIKKWGIKSIIEGISETHEEWEEIGTSRKFKITKDDGFGHKSIITEGYGDEYKFKDEFTEDVSTGEMMTQKQGYSNKRTWSSIIKQSRGKFYVHHIGQDANSSWEETWNEEPGFKWARKKGSSPEWGSWEEYWKETSDTKECKKWGKNGEEWFEEWKEDSTNKYCRKEQRKHGKIYIQEWKEIYKDEKMITKGCFLEDGIPVKEWDDIVILS
ncbi:unnamed protein product [Blepharisma stoltei]|uniref:Uncharacterized protein n=1 Tax=Blepharisma stoltei TaxID=1481888 RepID=A0AAU9I8Q6_9CILI|nr:unnamed protein product [Blepharisma stoltei]